MAKPDTINFVGDDQRIAIAAAKRAEAAADRVDLGALDDAVAATAADRTAAEAAATAAHGDAEATAADRVQTGLDRDATADDRTQTGANKTAAAASAAAAQASADRIDLGDFDADVAQVVADRVQTGLDRAATADDRSATHTDKLSADASAASAASSLATALALFNSIGPTQFFTSKTAANSGFAAAANLSTAQVYPDSTKGNRASLYYKNTATDPSNWIWIRYMDAPPTYYCHSKYGSDSNDGLTPDTPKQSLAAIVTLVGSQSGVTIMLGRGSHWYGQYPDFQNTAWSKAMDYGQGERWTIDGALALFTGTWIQDTNDSGSAYPGETWYQDFTLPNATQGGGPGDVNRWHIGMWDEKPAVVPSDISDTETRINEGWLKRVLNGDPDPNPATFDINRPQTTTLAYTQRSDFLAKVYAYRNTMTVFPAVGTGYEPNDGTPRTAFRAYVHLRDGSNPNTNGRTLRINEQRGLFTCGRGMDVHNGIFARCGAKDMVSGFQDLSSMPRASGPKDIFGGNFYNCSFWQAGAHGPVCNGMGGQDCDYIGHYMRDAYKGAAGAFHDFRSAGGVNKGLGMGWIRCKAKRGGYMFYCHGGGDGSDQQNRILYVDTGYAEDMLAIAVAGQASQGYWLRSVTARDIDSIGATCYPESTYENCKFIMRPGVPNSIGDGSNPLTVTYPVAHAGCAHFINSLVISLGTSLSLPKGPLATLTQPQMINLKMERSTIWGLIPTPGNANYRQINITMDRYSYLGVFDSGGAGDVNFEFYPSGVVTALGPHPTTGKAGSVIECLRTAPETIRAQQAGIEAGVETGIVRQLWQATVQQSDIVYVAPGSAVNTGTAGWTDNGDGSATVPTAFNFGVGNLGRSIKIALGNGATDYYGAITSIPNSSSIIVRPLPTAPITTAKAISVGYFRPFPFRDPVTAYISTDGLTLNVPSAQGFAVGQIIRVAHPVAGQPSFGIRKITAISGTLLTLDTACPWIQRQNFVTYRAIATPTTGTGHTLPTVSISWGFPIQARVLGDASFHDPQIVITRAEGGADIVMEQTLTSGYGQFVVGSNLTLVAFNSNGTTANFDNANYEAGYWYQAVSLAAGDTMKLYSLIDVAEDRLSFNTPPELGGYSPVNTCLLSQRGIGYRPSI